MSITWITDYIPGYGHGSWQSSKITNVISAPMRELSHFRYEDLLKNGRKNDTFNLDAERVQPDSTEPETTTLAWKSYPPFLQPVNGAFRLNFEGIDAVIPIPLGILPPFRMPVVINSMRVLHNLIPTNLKLVRVEPSGQSLHAPEWQAAPNAQTQSHIRFSLHAYRQFHRI